ncbi:unnamed protein product [Dovyalis caffra]|uniref:Uncharacterized protein n=1 Tax=Dovyalis caffra TaxID=77055 RepID=A0AAV1SEF3_9ROSI|nr:unnamed protein product [Dovyalis caffra]
MTQVKASTIDQLGLDHGLHEQRLSRDKSKLKMTILYHIERNLFAVKEGLPDGAHVILKRINPYLHIKHYFTPSDELSAPIENVCSCACNDPISSMNESFNTKDIVA